MSELASSPFFFITLTIVAYWVGVRAQKKTGLVVCNSMLITVALIIAVLILFLL